MTIKFKIGSLRERNFSVALQKLGNAQGIPVKTSLNIGRIIQDVEKESTVLEATFQKLLKDYANLDEKGEFVPNDGTPGTFSIKADKIEAWHKAAEEFNEQEFSIERPKIAVKDIEDVKLSAAEILTLEPMLSELSLVP